MRTSAWKQSLWLLLCCGVALAAPAAAHQPGEIEVERGRVDGPSGPGDYEIGTLYVRENRHNPNSRVIGVGLPRVKGPRPPGAPPRAPLPPPAPFSGAEPSSRARRKADAPWISSTRCAS